MKEAAAKTETFSFASAGWRRFKSDGIAFCGMWGIFFLLLAALIAPLAANSRPFILIRDGQWLFPFFTFFFAPDCPETVIEKFFNYALLCIPAQFLICLATRRKAVRLISGIAVAVLLLIPFAVMKRTLDTTDWQKVRSELKKKDFSIYAPVPFGPFEQVGAPYEKPSSRHWLGTDQIGRDVLARMLFGARVSLAVGIFATAAALLLGAMIGMMAGYFGGRTDLVIMRMVEIVICFPTFLLLLILMSMLKDLKFEQSILIVIAVIGLTGWTGLCRLVRGEVLKARELPYIQSCRVLGTPVWRIMYFHLLPNISGPILVSFTFGVAGAIIAESGLSFLGFGVQPPTASWGGLLREAFADPFSYWHLTLWPGLALFIAVCAFNFTGEGMRKIFDPKA